jgi:hypothetical protein
LQHALDPHSHLLVAQPRRWLPVVVVRVIQTNVEENDIVDFKLPQSFRGNWERRGARPGGSWDREHIRGKEEGYA